jgi:hypothetical protein
MAEPQPQQQNVNVSMTNEQWEAMQQLLRRPGLPGGVGGLHPLGPLSSGTITFDTGLLPEFPLNPGINLVSDDVYLNLYGVTFSVDTGGPGAGVYVVTDPTGRTRNVVSLNAPPINPWFNAQSGAIRVSFASPKSLVSIDAHTTLLPENLSPIENEPYLMAFDAAGNYIQGSETLYPVSPYLPGGTQLNPSWGTWQTITLHRPEGDIAAVEFSVQQTQGGAPVFGIFDNLHFQ